MFRKTKVGDVSCEEPIVKPEQLIGVINSIISQNELILRALLLPPTVSQEESGEPNVLNSTENPPWGKPVPRTH